MPIHSIPPKRPVTRYPKSVHENKMEKRVVSGMKIKPETWELMHGCDVLDCEHGAVSCSEGGEVADRGAVEG